MTRLDCEPQQITWKAMSNFGGAFSGRIEKSITGVPSFDIEEGFSDADPSEQFGVMTVFLNGAPYKVFMTYQEFLDFEKTGFSTAWLNAGGYLNPTGGWGWPGGRTTLTGFAAKYNRSK